MDGLKQVAINPQGLVDPVRPSLRSVGAACKSLMAEWCTVAAKIAKLCIPPSRVRVWPKSLLARCTKNRAPKSTVGERVPKEAGVKYILIKPPVLTVFACPRIALS